MEFEVGGRSSKLGLFGCMRGVCVNVDDREIKKFGIGFDGDDFRILIVGLFVFVFIVVEFWDFLFNGKLKVDKVYIGNMWYCLNYYVWEILIF